MTDQTTAPAGVVLSNQLGDAEKPRHPSMEPFKCPVCGSSYFGPLWKDREHVGRYCKGWPSGWDRSYNPCKGKHEELFSPPNTTDEPRLGVGSI